jgi:hypothetical protein
MVLEQITNAPQSIAKGFSPDSLFSRRILVSIIERETGPKSSLTFIVDLNQGLILTDDNAKRVEGSPPVGGNIDHCDLNGTQEIAAPNRDLTVQCLVVVGDAQGPRYSARVRRGGAEGHTKQWLAPPGWEIMGFAWSPDSKSIAILLADEKADLRPVGVLAMITSHPISLHSFASTLLSSELDHEHQLPLIRQNSPAGWARVEWVQ